MVDEANPMIQGKAMNIHFPAYFGFIEFGCRAAVIVVHGKHDELISVRVKRKKVRRKQCMISSTLITFNYDDIQ